MTQSKFNIDDKVFFGYPGVSTPLEGVIESITISTRITKEGSTKEITYFFKKRNIPEACANEEAVSYNREDVEQYIKKRERHYKACRYEHYLELKEEFE